MKAKKKRSKSRALAVQRVRVPSVKISALAAALVSMKAEQQELIRTLQQERELTAAFKQQMNTRLVELVQGKQLVLDPVLSQRLQTMANALSAPTYVVESKGGQTLNIMSVGSFAGTVKITVDV